jgi:hypothetical protein
MPDWFSNALEFLTEWGRAIVTHSSKPEAVAKVISTIGLLFAAYKLTDKVGDLYGYEIKLGIAILTLATFLVLAITLGMTWVRFKVMVIGEVGEPYGTEYAIPVTNTGFAIATIPVWLVEAMSEKGHFETYPRLPYKLPHAGSKEDSIFHPGIPEKVSLFEWVQVGGGICVYPTAKLGSTLDGTPFFCFREDQKKLWIKLAFGSSRKCKWFLVEWTSNLNQLDIHAEIPPHLPPTQWTRFKSWIVHNTAWFFEK